MKYFSLPPLWDTRPYWSPGRSFHITRDNPLYGVHNGEYDLTASVGEFTRVNLAQFQIPGTLVWTHFTSLKLIVEAMHIMSSNTMSSMSTMWQTARAVILSDMAGKYLWLTTTAECICPSASPKFKINQHDRWSPSRLLATKRSIIWTSFLN
ncbi:hypothetical protein BS17DRAFT_295589 [Gyrodon lividus]|nr:hypothetical protein BS17DRAFT_295589 [Gyrodon lividus]